MALTAALGAVAAAGTVAAVSSQQKAAKAQKQAAEAAVQNSQKQATAQEKAVRKAQEKTPNVAGLMFANQRANVGGTMLTGTGGAPVTGAQIGTNTLLGQ